MADRKKAILLRISADLAEALGRWARDELRSVNAQIEYVLREAVRKREGGGGLEDGAGAAFETVQPWLEQLVGWLRELGLSDWAQRLEGAVALGATPGQMLANLRANLEELIEAPVSLPAEVKRQALGLLRGLEEVGHGRAGPTGEGGGFRYRRGPEPRAGDMLEGPEPGI
jgi:hypothetical protein